MSQNADDLNGVGLSSENNNTEDNDLFDSSLDFTQDNSDGSDNFEEATNTKVNIWTMFLRSKKRMNNKAKRYKARCKFCKKIIIGKPERMEMHIENGCSKIDNASKLKYLSSPASSKSSLLEPKVRQTSMSTFFPSSINNKTMRDHHFRLLDSFISGNTSFNFANNKEFVNFIHCLNPAYKLPSRTQLSGPYLFDRYKDVYSKMLQHFSTSTDFTIGIDGWEDISGNSIYAALALKDGYSWPIEAKHFKGRPTAKNIFNFLNEALSNYNIGFQKVLAFVSDSPNVMQSLRCEIVSQHSHIIVLPCCLHVINLMIKDFFKNEKTKEALKKNIALVAFFKNSHYYSEWLKQWGKDTNKGHFLSPYCETRWYSASKLFLGVKSYQEGFKQALVHSDHPESPAIPSKIANIIKDEIHFTWSLIISHILSPMVDAIGFLEKSTSTLDEVFINLLLTYMKIQTLDLPNAHDIKEYACICISKRLNSFDGPIYFIALYLNPKYKAISISKKYNYVGIKKEILAFLKQWKYDLDTVEKLLYQLAIYNEDPYKVGTCIDGNGKKFWQSSFNSFELKCFALKVFSIVPHNAEVERLFSLLGLTKSPIRNRMSITTLKYISTIKYYLDNKEKENNISRLEQNISDQKSDNINEFIEANDEFENIESIIEENELIDTNTLSTGTTNYFNSIENFITYNFDMNIISPLFLDTNQQSAISVESNPKKSKYDWTIDDVLF